MSTSTTVVLRSLLAALPDRSRFRETARAIEADAWPRLFEESVRHGVSGMLEPYLEHDTIPEGVWKSFVVSKSAQALAYRELVSVLDRLVERFNRAGIRVCALKGPALAARLFDDPSSRVSTDLDFLLSPSDLERAVALLSQEGYLGASDATTAYLLRHSHHLDLSRQGAPPVELHFRSYVGFGVALPASALLDRAVAHRLPAGGEILVPAPEDELIYLAVHAAGHSFVRLSWLYEMKLLIAKTSPLDWDAVARRSREAGFARAVRYAIERLRDWLGMSLGDAVERFDGRTVRMLVADAMLERAATETGRGAGSNVKGLLFTAMLCDRVHSSGWLLQHHLLRSVRRKAYQLTPAAVPASWAG